MEDDVDGIADGLKYMCSLGQSELRIMGDKARNCYSERFDLERNAAELVDLIKALREREGDGTAVEGVVVPQRIAELPKK